METPITTQVGEALKDSLEDIVVVGGFNTDVGKSVWRGFWSRAMEGRGVDLPMVAIQPDLESPVDAKHASKLKLAVTKRIIVVVDGLPQPGNPHYAEDTLEAALSDIRKVLLGNPSDAIKSLTSQAIEVGDAEYAMAGDSRYVMAGFTVTLTCIEKY